MFFTRPTKAKWHYELTVNEPTYRTGIGRPTQSWRLKVWRGDNDKPLVLQNSDVQFPAEVDSYEIKNVLAIVDASSIMRAIWKAYDAISDYPDGKGEWRTLTVYQLGEALKSMGAVQVAYDSRVHAYVTEEQCLGKNWNRYVDALEQNCSFGGIGRDEDEARAAILKDAAESGGKSWRNSNWLRDWMNAGKPVRISCYDVCPDFPVWPVEQKAEAEIYA